MSLSTIIDTTKANTATISPEKLIIFNALFRKTDTGLIKSDNSNDADALLSQFSKLGK